MTQVVIIGPGRAGRSMAEALTATGSVSTTLVGRGGPIEQAAHRSDVVIIATRDGEISQVSEVMEPGTAAVVHLAGSLGLDVLAPHARRGALHPLVSLPDAAVGAARLAGGAWFGVAGDPVVIDLVELLGGRWFEVRDEDRAAYHAAAAVASNHLVALMGQVERIAAPLGIPLEAYLQLAGDTLENVRSMGPADALTGPAARGDLDTLRRHLDALDESEHDAYNALVHQARRLLT